MQINICKDEEGKECVYLKGLYTKELSFPS